MAIIDIGSTQISAALVSVSKDRRGRTKNQIIFSTKLETGIEGNFDYDRFDRATIKSLKQITHRILRSGFNRPEKFYCFLSSPFLISQTKVINYSQSTPFLFTAKMLNSMTKREAENFRVANEGNEAFSVIENKIMQIKSDGYEAENPFGHQVKTVRSAQFLSGSPESQLNKLRSAISGESHIDKIEFHSYVFAAFSALRDTLGHKNNFLIIDVGGELTDVMVCIDSVLLENISIPYGINSILRDASLGQKSFQSETTSQYKLYAENRLHNKTKMLFEKSLEIPRERWTSSMTEVAAIIAENSVLPEQIILTGDTAGNEMFVKWLKDSDLKKYTMANGELKISYIDHTNLAILSDSKKTVKDTYLILESMFLEKLIK